MAQSRLKYNLEKRAYHTIVLAVVGIIAIIVVLVLFGTKILIGFSTLSENFQAKSSPSDSQSKTKTYVAPPQLNPIVDATNSAQIAISGFGEQGQSIHLYRNGELVDKTTVRNDNHFKFPSISLQNGENTIKALAVTADNNKSDYSNEITVNYLSKPPEITINQPHDGQGFDRNAGPVNIEGQTDPGATVTINGFVAIVDDQGKFSYLYKLQDGDNTITAIAKDAAGNQATTTLHIHPN